MSKNSKPMYVYHRWSVQSENRCIVFLQEDLICDDEFLPSLAKMIFFAGVLVGALGFGILSDV